MANDDDGDDDDGEASKGGGSNRGPDHRALQDEGTIASGGPGAPGGSVVSQKCPRLATTVADSQGATGAMRQGITMMTHDDDDDGGDEDGERLCRS